jgi:exodeoxyribonuclease VII small subunit
MAKTNAKSFPTLAELMASSEPATAIATLRFEEGQALLQELVSRVESGEISLDRAVQSYELGSLLLKHLRSLLNQAEERVRVLRLDGSEVSVEG